MAEMMSGERDARPLRVCLVAPLPPPYGGIAHWAQMLLRHADGRDDVLIDVVDTAPRGRAIHDLSVWKRSVAGALSLLRDMAKILWVLARNRPDAIHLTTSGQLAVVRDLAVIAIARLARIPVVYHVRFGRVPKIAEAGTGEWHLMRRAMAFATVVVPIDFATEQALHRFAPEVRSERVPNCVNPAELPAPVADDVPVRTAMFLGWVIPTKGIEELVEAWARVRPAGWRLLVVGPGDEAYVNEVVRRHRPANIEFTGELAHAEAMRAMAASELFVLPSHTEGFPNAVLEAMTLGRAIVATSVGAIPEMLHGGCGVTVRPKRVGDLVDALARVLGDPALRRDLGARARARALGEYSIEAVFARYMSLWSERGSGASHEGLASE